jgi:hypothetical protein
MIEKPMGDQASFGEICGKKKKGPYVDINVGAFSVALPSFKESLH